MNSLSSLVQSLRADSTANAGAADARQREPRVALPAHIRDAQLHGERARSELAPKRERCRRLLERVSASSPLTPSELGYVREALAFALHELDTVPQVRVKASVAARRTAATLRRWRAERARAVGSTRRVRHVRNYGSLYRALCVRVAMDAYVALGVHADDGGCDGIRVVNHAFSLPHVGGGEGGDDGGVTRRNGRGGAAAEAVPLNVLACMLRRAADRRVSHVRHHRHHDDDDDDDVARVISLARRLHPVTASVAPGGSAPSSFFAALLFEAVRRYSPAAVRETPPDARQAESTMRAYAQPDEQARELCALLRLMHGGTLPALGMHPLSPASAWQLMFLLVSSTATAFDCECVAREFMALLMRAADRVATACRDGEDGCGGGGACNRAAAAAAEMVTSHMEQLAADMARSMVFGEYVSAERRALVATALRQVMAYAAYDEEAVAADGVASAASSVSAWRQRRARGADAFCRVLTACVEASGGDARFLDDARLRFDACAFNAGDDEATTTTTSTDTVRHVARALSLPLTPPRDVITVNALAALLAGDHGSAIPRHRHSWLYVLLLHYVALTAGDQPSVLARLPDCRATADADDADDDGAARRSGDDSVRADVRRYRERYRAALMAVARYAARPARVHAVECGGEEHGERRHDEARWWCRVRDVRAGDVARVMLACVRARV